MGNLINPLGGRVNLLNFWRHTWPVFYQTQNQYLYFQLNIHVRLLFNSFLQKVLKLFSGCKLSRSTVMQGLVIKILSNVWGFNNENFNVYLRFFDANVTVGLTKAIPHRFYLQRLFSGISALCNLRKFLFVKPVVSTVKKKLLFVVAERFLFKIKGYFYRFSQRVSRFSFRLQAFVKRAFSSFRKVLKQRLRAWHINLIVFTKPYFLYLCKIFNFKRCFIFTKVSKSSVSAAMVARYMAAKCQQGFSLNFVLNTVRRVIRLFINKSYGYKICASGRFTRKQIATYRWFKKGALTLNKREASVDYAQDSGFSKFGLFGIKIWIFSITNPQKI